MTISGYCQNQLILNNDGFIVLKSDTYLVVENDSSNAISSVGTGGNIISESESARIKWMVGSKTGSYVFPLTAPTHTKIPLTLNINQAGTGNGQIVVSSWTGGHWNNELYKPSTVSSMAAPGISNNSENVIDRFWIVDAVDFTTKPSGKMIFAYDDVERTTTGNSILPGTLSAQRHNDTSWLIPPEGSDNHPSLNVNNVSFSDKTFHKTWTLVNNLVPLPVELAGFTVACNSDLDQTEIIWSTYSESNVDYFDLQYSLDGTDFPSLKKIKANGFSNAFTEYQVSDDVKPGIIYYRLLEVDFDGTVKELSREMASCSLKEHELILHPNPSNGVFVVTFDDVLDQDTNFDIVALDGKVIYTGVFTGNSKVFNLDLGVVLSGFYLLRVKGQSYNQIKFYIL